jgi:hypothetical protein
MTGLDFANVVAYGSDSRARIRDSGGWPPNLVERSAPSSEPDERPIRDSTTTEN